MKITDGLRSQNATSDSLWLDVVRAKLGFWFGNTLFKIPGFFELSITHSGQIYHENFVGDSIYNRILGINKLKRGYCQKIVKKVGMSLAKRPK